MLVSNWLCWLRWSLDDAYDVLPCMQQACFYSEIQILCHLSTLWFPRCCFPDHTHFWWYFRRRFTCVFGSFLQPFALGFYFLYHWILHLLRFDAKKERGLQISCVYEGLTHSWIWYLHWRCSKGHPLSSMSGYCISCTWRTCFDSIEPLRITIILKI